MPTSPEHPLVIRLRHTGQRFRTALLKNERRILIGSILIFVALISAIGTWKIWAFAYNGLDLAIYNQVAWSSVHGRLFEFSIHPHSYLGDHLELAFALLFPIYALIQHPLTLIVLQAAAIAITVIPLVRIAERFVGRPWHLLFGLAFLTNPTVQSMALYEFHLLPFAMPLVSWALLAYLERKYWPFLLFLGLALTVREDISFVVIGFGILGLVDRRRWSWSVVPIVLGVAWLLGSLKLSGMLNQGGQYKFLIYYAWLGNSVPDIILNAFRHPLLVVQHLLKFQNLAFLAGLLLPLAGLPVFRLRWLIPAGLTLLQLMLAISSGELLIEIHYPAVIIPFLITAAAAAFQKILHPPATGLFHALGSERLMTTAVLVAILLYSMFVIGPLAKSVPVLASTHKIRERVQLERDVTHTVVGQSVVTGFEQITELSQQPQLYSLHYILLGKKQFSDVDYILPPDVTTVLLDQRDALIYQLLYEDQDQRHHGGYARIRQLLLERGFVPTEFIDRFVVYRQAAVSDLATYATNTRAEPLRGTSSEHAELTFLGWSTNQTGLTTATKTIGSNVYTYLPFALNFAKTTDSDEIRQIEIRLLSRGQVAYRTLMPLGGSIYPSSDWQLSEPVTSYLRPLLPEYLNEPTYDVEVRVMRLRGDVVLNGVRSLSLRYNQYETIGSPIQLGQLSITR